jgi:hypothetical protein
MNDNWADFSHDHLPTKDTVVYATDGKLDELADFFQEHVEDCEEDACLRIADWIEREQAARSDWNSDDDRVREAVGNYRSRLYA